jgi:hypothetical protein
VKQISEETAMKHQKNLRERYIQLVETFITALESGKSGSELEDIRNEIRIISAQLGLNYSVENSTQILDTYPLKKQTDGNAVE